MIDTVGNNLICEFIRGTVEGIPDVNDEIAWGQLYQAALRHHLEAYLYFSVINVNGGRELPCPFEIFGLFKERFYTVASANVRLLHEAGCICQCLNENNIKVVLLKGIYLASEVYENQSLRPMVDIDLLIAESDLERSVELLSSLGFFPEKEYFMEALNETQIHIPALIKRGTNPNCPDIPVELHWSIFRPKIKKNIDIDSLWERAIPVEIDGINSLALSLEDNINHFAVHISFDDLFANGLLPLMDIMKLLEKYNDVFCWDRLYEICSLSGTERHVFLTLFLAKKLLGAKVPDDFFKKLGLGKVPSEIIGYAEEMIFRQNDEEYAKAVFIGRTVEGNIFQKTCRFFKKIFPSRSELSEIYGKPPKSFIILFYYPLRWKDVFFRYFSVMLKIITCKSELKDAVESGTHGRKLAEWLAL